MPTDHAGEHGGSLLRPQGPPPSSSGSSEGSPSSLIMARGRSRVRRISSDVDPFSEENLRRRCVSGGDQISFSQWMIRTCCIFLSTQWLPQSQIVRPDFPPRKAMEASTRDGLWGLWRRNVSIPSPHHIPYPFVLVFSPPLIS